jgi:repressor LexA
METLTKKQKLILDFISNFIVSEGYSPSYREIAQQFNFSSVATVADHIQNLKNKGYLNSETNIARSLEINKQWEEKNTSIPLAGCISAGYPIEGIRVNERLDIPKDMSGPGVYALKVKGDSMIDDGILDGDYVVLEQCNNPVNGDIVVALLDKENVTLKRYYKENNYIRLQPANKKYTAIKTRYVDIQGKVKGIIRKFR